MLGARHFSYTISDPNGDSETGIGVAADILPILEAAEMTGASVVIVDIDTGEALTEADVRAAATRPT
jgi:hypothetical protein